MGSSDNAVITVTGVAKKFCRSLRRSMRYGMQDICRNMFGLSAQGESLRLQEFWALNDVSFTVSRGETLGIIGPNGSGKTTLLKLLNGIFMPDRGRIEIQGRVGALIEVGAGFHPLLTGRENIYINAAILGMTRKEVDARFDAIVAFADIGDFLDTPVKNYSSGMHVRLGFAIAVHCEPDILLIDEVLAVGDVDFRLKCIEKIKEFQRIGRTIVFISHDMSTVKKICRRCCWIEAGALQQAGLAVDVADRYEDHMRRLQAQAGRRRPEVNTSLVNVRDIWSERDTGERRGDFVFGETIIIGIRYVLSADIAGLIFGIALYAGDNTCVSALNTGLDSTEIRSAAGEHEIHAVYPAIKLMSGTYHFDLGFFEGSAVQPFFYLSRAITISVKSPYVAEGLLAVEHSWRAPY